jgi:hypothetical protein
MPRRPNYSYERMQRERAKAEKKEAKAAAKAAAKARGDDPADDEAPPDDEDAAGVSSVNTRESVVEQ